MLSLLPASSHAGKLNVARPPLIERRLRRYNPRFQGVVRALASRNTRLAELAGSFPALLFTVAVPRPGFDPEATVALAIDGAPLACLAEVASVPLWLRRLPPEAFVRPIPELPDSELFRRHIANHIPASTKLVPNWLQAISDAAKWGNEALAVWIARELVREARALRLGRMHLISLWAWFSRRPDTWGHRLIDRPWRETMRFATALEAAETWRARVWLHLELGTEPIVDMWLQPDSVEGYDFVPLRSADDICSEAAAMKNCLRTFGYTIAHNRSRLWSVRKNGERIATLQLACRSSDPFPRIVQLALARNKQAPAELWWAARQWPNKHELPRVDSKPLECRPLDRPARVSLWRPYWLAKRRIPDWLPLATSRRAFYEL